MDDGSKAYGKGLARAFGGALLFSLPLLMTMEMWWLGFSMEPARLLLFLTATLPMLLGLSYYAGFEPTFDLKDEVLDALAGFAVGVALSAAALALFGLIRPGMAAAEIAGKVALAAVPGAIGALLATKQLGQSRAEQPRREIGFLAQLFLMVVGAVFLAFNVAPTEEMALIAYQMTPAHGLLLVAVSILLLHVMVYELGFPGEDRRRGLGAWRAFLTRTAPGYGIALLVSAYMLWSFGRLDGAGAYPATLMVVVLALPAAVGAASARLVV